MKDKVNIGINGNSLENIKSKYILQLIFFNLHENLLLQVVKYNKNIQKKLGKDINDYKTYKGVIIEIIPINKEYRKDRNTFINYKKEEKKHFYIYFNGKQKKKEIILLEMKMFQK